MSVEKNALRHALRGRLRSLTPEARAAASARLCDRLRAWGPAFPGRVVAGFLALPGEPDLAGWYREAEVGGARLAFPLITGAGAMEFRVLSAGFFSSCPPAQGPSVLRPGPHGLREPDPAACPVVTPSAVDLVLVPGLGFAPGGARLGRGAGYYDRWLATLPAGARTIGVAFACQVLPEVPSLAHDWRVDHILTDDGWVPGARGLPLPPPDPHDTAQAS
jgi:5-formyltetrahydrofolate cyclo-ligase